MPLCCHPVDVAQKRREKVKGGFLFNETDDFNHENDCHKDGKL